MKKIIVKLEQLTEVRRAWGNLRHKLVDIVFIGLVSVICGGVDFEHMEDTGEAKYDWFKKFPELPNGIPSGDTFRRVFERMEDTGEAKYLAQKISGIARRDTVRRYLPPGI